MSSISACTCRPNYTTVSVLDLLLATNAKSHLGRLNDLDEDGDANDTWKRCSAP